MNVFDKLRPWQLSPVETLRQALALHRSAVDFSDTGTGKTYVACAVEKLLGLPTLVVCPKISQSMWHEVVAHFNDTLSVINYELLRTGNTPYGTWTNSLPPGPPEPTFTCQCCQQKVDIEKPVPCYTNTAGVHCIVAKKTKHNYGAFRFAPQIGFVVFDEVHRCGGLHSLNSDILIAAKRQNKYILGLSATPACSPLQMRALGYVLGLHTLIPSTGLGFYEWARSLGCRKPDGFPGFKWMKSESEQKQIMRDLHARIIPSRGVRVRTTDIPNFPTRTISAETYDIENPEKIDALYSQMAEPLAKLEDTKLTDVAPDSALTKILRARQKLELLKVPLAIELWEDYRAKGFSVAFFVNFSATVDALAIRIGTDCIIDGRPENVKHRNAMVNTFQANREKEIIANNEAGGISIGLQDLDGEHPRVGLVFPCFSAVTMRQVFGRLPRDGGKSHSHYRVLFAAGTVEGPIARALRAKSNNLDSLNDADMMPENFRLIKV